MKLTPRIKRGVSYNALIAMTKHNRILQIKKTVVVHEDEIRWL